MTIQVSTYPRKYERKLIDAPYAVCSFLNVLKSAVPDMTYVPMRVLPMRIEHVNVHT
jgi:hypothetical protein